MVYHLLLVLRYLQANGKRRERAEMIQFCPQATDLGTVADWVSGIASSSAVAVALWVAVGGHLKNKKVEYASGIREAETENALRAEALTILKKVRGATSGLLREIREGEGYVLGEWQTFLGHMRDKALRFQRLPGVNIKVYRIFDDIVDLCRQDDADELGAGDFELNAQAVVDRSQRLTDKVLAGADPRSEMVW